MVSQKNFIGALFCQIHGYNKEKTEVCLSIVEDLFQSSRDSKMFSSFSNSVMSSNSFPIFAFFSDVSFGFCNVLLCWLHFVKGRTQLSN